MSKPHFGQVIFTAPLPEGISIVCPHFSQVITIDSGLAAVATGSAAGATGAGAGATGAGAGATGAEAGATGAEAGATGAEAGATGAVGALFLILFCGCIFVWLKGHVSPGYKRLQGYSTGRF